MQTVANLRLLELAKPRVDAREQRVFIVLAARLGHTEFLVQPVFDDGRENRPTQQLCAPRIDHQRVVVLVDLPLEVLQRSIAFGARERRHQMIDDHGLCTPFRLRALARIVDDERIKMRHRPEHEIGPACIAQRHALARQPFEIAMLADMDDGVDAETLA